MFCEDEIDAVWEIQWPNTLVGNTATVPCGVDFIGNDIYMYVHVVQKSINTVLHIMHIVHMLSRFMTLKLGIHM